MSSAVEPGKTGDGFTSRLVGALLVVLGYEVLAHWFTASGYLPWLNDLLAVAPLAFLFAWIIWRRRNILDWLVLGGAAFVMLSIDKLATANALHALPHVAVTLFVASLFGRTLLPGQVALVTRLARHVHGALPEVISAYTRRLTWIWFLFMSAVALASLLLSCLASLTVWSLFANVLTLPLAGLLFALEYAYRRWRFPWFQHASPAAAMRAFCKLSVRDA